MIQRVRLGSESLLFWVDGGDSLRVYGGYGGEVVGGAHALDREMASRERFSVPRPMPAQQWGNPEFETGIERRHEPCLDGYDYTTRGAADALIEATKKAGRQRRKAARIAAKELLEQHVKEQG